jgi:ADP-heptose:LPS heptosyltransferase
MSIAPRTWFTALHSDLLGAPASLRWIGELLFRMAGFRRPQRAGTLPARIALVKLDRLGDLVLLSHFLAELREAFPRTRITLLVRQQLVDLARLCPSVDEVVGVPVVEGRMIIEARSGRRVQWFRQLARWLLFCFRAGIWKSRFDVVIVPRCDIDYYGAVPLAYLTGAPIRWGYSERASEVKACLNQGFDQLLAPAVAGLSDRHEFELNEALLRALGVSLRGPRHLLPWIGESERQEAREILQRQGVNVDEPMMVVCLGAGSANKMWPVESYATLLRQVVDLDRIQLATFGAMHERKLGLRLRELLGPSVINLEGHLPLRCLPAAVAQGTFYLGSDTGTMHLAAAGRLPVFAVYCHPRAADPLWAESPRRFGPWDVPHRVVQPAQLRAPCSGHCTVAAPHCILGVSAAEAAEALRGWLAEIGRPELCRPRS